MRYLRLLRELERGNGRPGDGTGVHEAVPCRKAGVHRNVRGLGASLSNALRAFVSAFDRRDGSLDPFESPYGFNAEAFVAADDTAAGCASRLYGMASDRIAVLDEG